MPFKNCRKYNSICDFAEANLEDLLPSLEVPLRAGFGHCISADMLQLLSPGAGHFWVLLTVLVCLAFLIKPFIYLFLGRALRLSLPAPRKVLLSVPPKMLLPSGWPGQDGQGYRWGNGAGWGNGQGNEQTLIELFQTPKFLLFFTEEFRHTCPSDCDQSQE